MKLYSYFRSSAAYRVRIALNLKNVVYETIPIHLVRNGGEQHSQGYLNVNSQGLVPSLDVADTEGSQQVITQSPAIIEYLEERFPEPALLPENLLERASVRSLVQVIACDIHPLNNLRVLGYIEGVFGCSKKAKMEWYHHWLVKGFEAIETVLESNSSERYCCQNQVTMADVYLIPQVYNALRFNLDITPYPEIYRVYQQCSELTPFHDAAPEEQLDAE